MPIPGNMRRRRFVVEGLRAAPVVLLEAVQI